MHVCMLVAGLAYWVLYEGIPRSVLSTYFLLEHNYLLYNTIFIQYLKCQFYSNSVNNLKEHI